MVGGLLTGGALAGLLIGIAAASIQHGNLLQGGIAGAFLGGVGAGALGGLAAFAPNSVQRIIAQVGMAVLSVAAIVVGAMLIPGAGPWMVAEGVFAIASGCLSLGSQAAGLAGDYRLSESLGYAALGCGVAAMACGSVEELGVKSAGDGQVQIEETYTDNSPSQTTTTHSQQEFEQHYKDVVAQGKQIQGTVLRYHSDVGDGSMITGEGEFLHTSSYDDTPGAQAGLTKTFGQMKATFQQAFAPNAKIQLESCMSARSMQVGQSIGADFKNALPGAKVYGYPAYTYGVQIGSFRRTLTWWRQIEVVKL